MRFSRFVIVTGLSGAGKSQAMKTFEDLGFSCLDNLPPALALEAVSLAERAGIDRLAISLDVLTGGVFGDALGTLAELDTREVSYELVYLDASEDAIVRRYSETRRRHPLAASAGLADAIVRERLVLAPFRARASRVWDTSSFTHAMLKARIVDAFATEPDEHSLAVRVVAFGYKYGLPLDADLVFDVRFLQNPNYVPELKPLSGTDGAVAAFLEAMPEMHGFLDRLYVLIDYLLPRYRAEGKSRLTVAIGCTGGRHRSVYVAERLAAHLRDDPALRVSVEHRELVTA